MEDSTKEDVEIVASNENDNTEIVAEIDLTLDDDDDFPKKRRRKRTDPPQEKPPQTCDQCPKQFKTTTALNKHYRTHTGERMYICAECGKTFTQLGHLKNHELSHLGKIQGKPFPCPQCEKRFLRKCEVDRHVRVHNGDRPFLCNICPKGFTQKNNLVLHLKMHNNERNFVCVVCSKRFITKCKLTNHMRKHPNSYFDKFNVSYEGY